jgi:hypothetical protein
MDQAVDEAGPIPFKRPKSFFDSVKAPSKLMERAKHARDLVPTHVQLIRPLPPPSALNRINPLAKHVFLPLEGQKRFFVP